MRQNIFVDYIKEHFTSVYHAKVSNRTDIEYCIKRNYDGAFNTVPIVDYCFGMGRISFNRIETVSKDKLSVNLIDGTYLTYFWGDIGGVVNCIGYIENCGGEIENFYISEHGKFYNQNHKLIAESTEDFLDYVVTVEYDYHHETSERTYKMLRHFGWYEGRRIDTTAFNVALKQCGITLSQAQLDFFSEFSGLNFTFTTDGWCFFDLNEVVKYLSFTEFAFCDGEVVGRNVIQCGEMEGCSLFINSNGIITCFETVPKGRTTMECINHLCNNNIPEDEWL